MEPEPVLSDVRLQSQQLAGRPPAVPPAYHLRQSPRTRRPSTPAFAAPAAGLVTGRIVLPVLLSRPTGTYEVQLVPLVLFPRTVRRDLKGEVRRHGPVIPDPVGLSVVVRHSGHHECGQRNLRLEGYPARSRSAGCRPRTHRRDGAGRGSRCPHPSRCVGQFIEPGVDLSRHLAVRVGVLDRGQGAAASLRHRATFSLGRVQCSDTSRRSSIDNIADVSDSACRWLEHQQLRRVVNGAKRRCHLQRPGIVGVQTATGRCRSGRVAGSPLPTRMPSELRLLTYQVTYQETEVPETAGYLHAQWRRAVTERANPDYVIADGIRGQGKYGRHLPGLDPAQQGLVRRGGDQVLPGRRHAVPYHLRHRHRGLPVRQLRLPRELQHRLRRRAQVRGGGWPRPSGACTAGTSWTRSTSPPTCASPSRRSAGGPTASTSRWPTTSPPSAYWYQNEPHAPFPDLPTLAQPLAAVSSRTDPDQPASQSGVFNLVHI